MDIKEKLWQEELKRLEEAPSKPVKPYLFWPVITFIAITVLVAAPMLIIYSYDNHQLKAEFKQMKAGSFNPLPIMQPVMFSPYYIIKPEDDCPPLELVELGGIRSCQKSI